jgi:RNA polymerase sigma factor (sigma-70 family)
MICSLVSRNREGDRFDRGSTHLPRRALRLDRAHRGSHVAGATVPDTAGVPMSSDPLLRPAEPAAPLALAAAAVALPPVYASPLGISGEERVRASIAAELPRLRRHAYSLLYSRADAEDLVQDCLETALAKSASLKDPERLRAWLFAILNNLFVTRLRSRARRGPALPIEDFADSLAASVPAADRDTARDLAKAMGKLSAEHRQVLLLINVEGQSYQEAADALEVPIGTVMSRLARARQRLRDFLEGGGLHAVD